jgi:hypothetical protein
VGLEQGAQSIDLSCSLQRKLGYERAAMGNNFHGVARLMKHAKSFANSPARDFEPLAEFDLRQWISWREVPAKDGVADVLGCCLS